MGGNAIRPETIRASRSTATPAPCAWTGTTTRSTRSTPGRTGSWRPRGATATSTSSSCTALRTSGPAGHSGWDGPARPGRGTIKELLRRRLFGNRWHRWARERREGMHRLEEGSMTIALRENPRPGEAGEVAADPAARARLARSRTSVPQPCGPPPRSPCPTFPPRRTWINAPFVRMGTLLGRNAPLVWFWDIGSLNSMRALPYVLEWHRRYADLGLRVIGVHSPQFDFGHDAADGRAGRSSAWRSRSPSQATRTMRSGASTATRCGPRLYLWDRRGVLRHYHFGEGLYDETETAIGEVLREIDEEVQLPDTMAPLRPTDAPGRAREAPHSAHLPQPGPLRARRSPRARRCGSATRPPARRPCSTAPARSRCCSTTSACARWCSTVRASTSWSTPGAHEEHELALVFEDAARAYAFSFVPGPA